MRKLAHSSLSVVFVIICGACTTITRTEMTPVASASECVVLLHGLNRSWRAMDRMAVSLRAQGFSTANVDYPSQRGSIEELAPEAVNSGVAQCRNSGATRVHFVTHSMGGILLRYAHGSSPIPDLGRVVMLGPPNQGSEVIDVTRGWPLTRMISGPAGEQLGTSVEDIPARLAPVDFELGVVAGTGTLNPFMSAMLPREDDGKVSVDRTRAEGMSDFLILAVSHFAMMRDPVVIQNTAAFLRSGQFSGRNISD